jgi:hypothetical protein
MPDAYARLRRLTGLTRRELELLDPETITHLVAEDLDEEVVWRVRRVRRLRRDLGLQYDAVEIIVRLLERIDALERRRV